MHQNSDYNQYCFTNTIGLVLCGGRSSRMGIDKSMMMYHTKPQRYYLCDMLTSCCERVFISCNKQQSSSISNGYHFIEDNPLYSESGPIGALLTALEIFPDKSILLIGCDYPFLTVGDLTGFSRICTTTSAAFYNTTDKVYIPVLAWYPPDVLAHLHSAFNQKQYALQRLLQGVKALKYMPDNILSMQSVDTVDMYHQAYEQLNRTSNH